MNLIKNEKKLSLKFKSFIISLFLLIALLSISVNYVQAVAPPFNPNQSLPKHLKTYSQNYQQFGQMIEQIKTKPDGSPLYSMGDKIGPPKLQDYIKNNSNIKLLVLLVEFSDVRFESGGKENVTAMVNTMATYFRDQSRNTITITPTIHPTIFQLNKTMAFYGATDDIGQLCRDTVALADPTINFAQYQCLMIAHAGYGDETSGISGGGNDIWSMYWYRVGDSGNLITTNDGVAINGITVVPEKEYNNVSALGIVCHEFGHQFGLPDLYDTTYSTEGGIGYWSLMAFGSYNGNPRGSKPAPLDPICRKLLNWLDVVNITENQQNFEFLSNKTYRLEKGGATSGTDYFFVEKRAKIPGSWDEGLPGEGLLVYHVNGLKESNSTPNDTTPRLIELLSASGGNHLTVSPRSGIRGLDTDPYPTSTNKDFHNLSNPSSKTWDNKNSFVGIRNITKTGTGQTLVIKAEALLVKPQLIIVSGNNQQAQINTQFAQPLKVMLIESSGPIGANPVTFTVVSGSANINGLSTVNTNALGNAEVTVTAGNTAGNVVIKATTNVSGIATPIETTFNLTVTSGSHSVGPQLLNAMWVDINSNNITDANDRIVLTFDKKIVLSNVSSSDFLLLVSGDTFGTSPLFIPGPLDTQMSIVLGQSAKINPFGTFSPLNTAPGSPSGINLSPTSTNIKGEDGSNARPAELPIDIGSPTVDGPKITSAHFMDVNLNNIVDANDKLILTFDKDIIISNVSANDFVLPVQNDSLGTNPTFSMESDPKKLIITLGTTPKLTILGVFNPANITAGSPSGINISPTIAKGHIKDVNGNDAVPSPTVIDITGMAETGDVSSTKSYFILKNPGSQPFIANGQPQAIFEATILDDSNNAIPNCDVFIESDKNISANKDIFTPASPAKTDISGKVSFSLKTVYAGIRNISLYAQKPGYQKKQIGTVLQVEYKAGPVSPSLSKITASKTIIQADNNDSAEVFVSLVDANNNPVVGKQVTITATPSNGITITPPTTTSDFGGNAKFNIKSSQAVNNVTITAICEGNIVLNQVITLNFTSPQISFAFSTVEEVTPNATYIANGEIYANLVITVKNASNLPISGIIPQVNVLGSENIIKNSDDQLVPPNTLKPTNQEGKTYFKIASKVAEVKQVIVKINNVELNQKPNLNFVAGPFDKILYSSGNQQIGTVNKKLPIPLKVKVTDAFNNAVSNVLVKFKITYQPPENGETGKAILSKTEMQTDSGGFAFTELTFGKTVGVYKVSAELQGAKGSPITFTLEAKSDVPANIIILSGNNQNGAINQPLFQPIKVKVVDSGGNPCSQVIVHFRQVDKPLEATDCILTKYDVATDDLGIAQTNIQSLGNKVGNYKIRAFIDSTKNVDFTLTAIAGNPNQIEILEGNGQQSVVNKILTQKFKVKVIDDFGNGVSSPIPGCTVRFFVYKGNGSFIPTEGIVQTNANGIAEIQYKVGTKIGQEEIWATVEGNYQVTPARFIVNLISDIPFKVVNANYYNTLYGKVGTRLLSPFSIKVLDQFDNPISDCLVDFTIKTTPNTLGASLYSIEQIIPSNSKTNYNGVVDCYVKVGNKIGTYEVEASVSSIGIIKFNAVATSGTVNPNNTTLALISSNNVKADGIETIEVQIECKDDYNNPVSGAYVYFYSDSNTPLNITQPQLPTDMNGIAKALIKSTKSGKFKVKASVNGINILNDIEITFISGDYSILNSTYYLDKPPLKVLANGNDFYNVKILMRDLNNNPVINVNKNKLLIRSIDGNVEIEPPVNNSDNEGAFYFKVKSYQQGIKKIEVFIDGQRLKTNEQKDYLELTFITNPIDINKSFVETANTSSTIADGNMTILLKVFLKDTDGIPISGFNFNNFILKFKNLKNNNFEELNVTWNSPFYNTSDNSYNFKISSTKAFKYEVNVEINDNTENKTYLLKNKPIITFLPGAPSQIIKVNTNDIYAKVGERSLTLLSTKVLDGFNNPVSNVLVKFSLDEFPNNSQNIIIENTDVYTNEEGIATTSVTLGTKVGQYKFKASSTGLNGSPIIFNVYAIPGPTKRYELKNIPIEVTQGQTIRQIEVVAYDQFDNIKYDCMDSIYLTSNDQSAILPYNSINNPFTFSPSDNGRKVFNEGIIFLTQSQATTLTIKKVSSVDPLEITSPPIRVIKGSTASINNFKIGMFFIPDSSNKMILLVKSKNSLLMPPKVSISFDGGNNFTYDLNTSAKANIYYKLIETQTKPLKANIKVFGQTLLSNEYVFSEETINF